MRVPTIRIEEDDTEIATVVIETPGVPGAPGTSGGGSVDFTYTAGVDIGGHRVVTVNSSNELVYVSSDNASHAGRAVGISLGAASAGDQVTVRSYGDVELPFSWTYNTPIFISLNGTLSQDDPSIDNGDMFAQIIGFPTSATSMHISLQPAIILG